MILFFWLVCSAVGKPELVLRPGLAAIQSPRLPRLYEAVPDADRMEPNLTLDPPAPFQWVFDEGEPFRINVAGSAKAAGDQAVLTAWDWEVRPVAQLRFAIPFAEAVNIQVEGRGTYLLSLDLFAGGSCVARLVRSFSVCPSNLERRKDWAKEEFFVGTCAFPGRQHWRNEFGMATPPGLSQQESRELDAELSARLGLQVVRPDLPVEWVGEEAPLDFSKADTALEAWTSRGFKLDLQLWMPGDWAILPEYANVPDPKWRYPKREGPCRKYVSECVKRYGSQAAFIELNNEPDIRDFWRGRPEQYVEWARWAIEEIRQVAPQIMVVNGGYSFNQPELTGFFARELRGWIDGAAYHAHGMLKNLEDRFDTMRALQAALDWKNPIFLNTEMGYAAWRLDIERTQAATAAQKVFYCWAHRHRGALLYCSRDVGGPRLRPDDPDWGYLDYFFCPRFIYGALAALINRYAGAHFESILQETDHLHAYLFSAEGKRLVAAFVPYDGRRSLTLESDAFAVQIVDPMGNATPTPPGRVSIDVTFYPQTIVLEGATTVQVVEER